MMASSPRSLRALPTGGLGPNEADVVFVAQGHVGGLANIGVLSV